MFAVLRFRLRALRVRILDRTIRRLARRHRLFAFLAAAVVTRLTLEKVLWRGKLQPGDSLTVTVRQPDGPATGAG